MKKLVFSVVGVCVWALFAASAFALDLSSDIVSTSQGHKQTSKMYLQGTKARMEHGQQPGYTIMRPDKNMVWMVMPDQKSYMEMRFDPSKQPKTGEKVNGEVSRKLIGSETVDGHPCQKYEVTYKDKETSQKMYQWMATDIKFPVKTAAVDGSWMVEYRNIKMGAQPDSLFEVPAGFKKMSMSFSGMAAGAAGLKQNQAPAEQEEAAQTPAGDGAGESSSNILKKIPKVGIPKLPKW
jgi:outer membrane lipoprotein-sorting protein